MQTPNIFLHYYNSDEATVTFQEIIQSDVSPEILEIIQEELLHQLSDVTLAEKLPNFDWQHARMQEKWQSAVNLLLPHVMLPDFIWQGWIASISTEMTASAPAVPSFAELLTADIYYASPIDSLPEIPEEVTELAPEEEEIEIPVIAEVEIEEEEEEEEVLEEIIPVLENIPDFFEVTDELPALDTTDPEIVKSINELHAESAEEKVLDTIQVSDHSLKNMVEINMTQSLWESISLFQKLNFIQDLFNGNADEFQRLVEFVDNQATANQWKSEIEGEFGQHLTTSNEDTWNEFYILVDRKFN
jgi:hypothetical protein